MADTLHTFSPSTAVLHDLSKNHTTENVVCKQPSHNGSSLNNTHTPDKIQCQPQYGSKYNMDLTSPFIGSRAQDEIESYKIWSILNILFCCSCLGCIACYYSNETEDLKKKRNIQGALYASEKARNINVIATVTGTIIIIFVGLSQTAALQRLV
jgi:hypothetical protein